ncbi:glycosyltransferase 87 family protein [Rhodococcoides fascians]|uniref:glycosyltransferase 87 family protein n=1 Tax=Rhodococcoides fascians TaxID=1828 RepID=UPI00055A009E|nr:glycosyltransferase 87 family protein [Rhodococcus fascians]
MVGSVIAVVVAVAAHGWFLGWRGAFGLFGNGVDTIVYRHGGQMVADGLPLYEFALFEVGLPFTYPPFAALVFVPLAWMSVDTAIAVMQIVNAVLVYAAVMASWRILGYRGPRVWLISVGVAAGVSWLEPVRMTMWLGQINLLLLVLVLFDLARADGSRLRGVGVGIAAGLKLTPAFFVLYLLVLRQWRSAVTAAAVFAVTVAAGVAILPKDAWRFFTGAMSESERIGALASPANQSLHGALARAWPGHTPPVWVWLAGAVVVAAIGLWAAQRAYRGGNRLLGLTICGLSTPMVSPFAWGHHWVWCIPLTVLALDYAHRHRSRWAWTVPVAVILPVTAWFFTDYRGIKAIGIFMFEGPAWFDTAVQLAYPALFAAVVAATALSYRGASNACR